MNADFYVRRLKERRLNPDLQGYRPAVMRCVACGMTTDLVTVAWVHATLIHNRKD